MTVTYFGGPTLEVSFAPTKGAGDTVAGGDWVDITAHVRDGVQIQRGRSSERDTFQTGTCSFTLNNRARLFDPEYAAGTYYGQLLPMRPVRVRMTYSAVTYDLFRGFIQGWPQSWEPSNHDSVVQIVAHDAFKVLATAQLPESRWTVEVAADTPAAWYRLGEESGSTVMTDSSGNNRHGTYVTTSTYNPAVKADSIVTYSADGARQVVQLNAGEWNNISNSLPYTLTGTAWSIECWATIPAWDSVIDASQIFGQYVVPAFTAPKVTLSYDYDATTPNMLCRVDDATGNYTSWQYSTAGTESSFLGVHHHFAVTYTAGSAKFYIDGVEISPFATSGTLTGSSWGTVAQIGYRGGAGTVVDEVAMYASTLSAARVLAHYQAGSSADAGNDVDGRLTQALSDAGLTWISTSFDDSAVTVRGADYGTSTFLSYAQMLEQTERGRLFVSAGGTLTFHSRYHDMVNVTTAAAFTDVAGGALYVEAEHEYDDTRIVNDCVASRTNGVAQRASDATSKTAYGTRSLTIDGLANQSDAESLDMATAVVAKSKDPYPRIRSLQVKPRNNAATLYPIVGAVEVGSKVTFRRAPLGGTAFTKTLRVEGVTHSISYQGEWVTTYLTAPDEATTMGWWVLEDATYGILGTAKVGY